MDWSQRVTGFLRGSWPIGPRSPGSYAGHSTPGAATDCRLPARLTGTIRLEACASSNGPLISLRTSVVLPGLQARITFRDRPRGDDAQVQESSVMVRLVLPGEQLERPPRAMRIPPRRTEFTLTLCDGQREPLAAPQKIECVDGTRPLDILTRLDLGAAVSISAHAPWGSPTARLRVNGKLVFSRGVIARLDLGPVTRPEERERVAPELSLISPGTMFFFHERTVDFGLPGDPWISLRFFDERGTAMGEEHPIGLFHAA